VPRCKLPFEARAPAKKQRQNNDLKISPQLARATARVCGRTSLGRGGAARPISALVAGGA
jgi:hypothetical protein